LLEGLTGGLDQRSPRDLDRRFRRAIAFLQEVDGGQCWTAASGGPLRSFRKWTVANAFREGRITLLQAEVLLGGGVCSGPSG
jgi:hypothetical protein